MFVSDAKMIEQVSPDSEEYLTSLRELRARLEAAQTRRLVGSRAEEAIFLEGGVVVKLDVLGKEALLADRDAPRFLDRVL